MNVIIVDDEPLALDVLETYVSRMPDLNLIGRCNNAFEANEMLKNHDIDLMFLDIQMPQLTGIEFLKTLSKPPMVVFTTAYPNYAVEGFEKLNTRQLGHLNIQKHQINIMIFQHFIGFKSIITTPNKV